MGSRLDPRKFTLGNMPARLERKKTDPLLPLLSLEPDLLSALGKLAELTG